MVLIVFIGFLVFFSWFCCDFLFLALKGLLVFFFCFCLLKQILGFAWLRVRFAFFLEGFLRFF